MYGKIVCAKTTFIEIKLIVYIIKHSRVQMYAKKMRLGSDKLRLPNEIAKEDCQNMKFHTEIRTFFIKKPIVFFI